MKNKQNQSTSAIENICIFTSTQTETNFICDTVLNKKCNIYSIFNTITYFDLINQ